MGGGQHVEEAENRSAGDRDVPEAVDRKSAISLMNDMVMSFGGCVSATVTATAAREIEDKISTLLFYSVTDVKEENYFRPTRRRRGHSPNQGRRWR